MQFAEVLRHGDRGIVRQSGGVCGRLGNCGVKLPNHELSFKNDKQSCPGNNCLVLGALGPYMENLYAHSAFVHKFVDLKGRLGHTTSGPNFAHTFHINELSDPAPAIYCFTDYVVVLCCVVLSLAQPSW